MTEPSHASEEAVLRSLAIYQDALVRIADLVRIVDSDGSVADPVRDICFRAHREVAVVFDRDHAQSAPENLRRGASD